MPGKRKNNPNESDANSNANISSTSLSKAPNLSTPAAEVSPAKKKRKKASASESDGAQSSQPDYPMSTDKPIAKSTDNLVNPALKLNSNSNSNSNSKSAPNLDLEPMTDIDADTSHNNSSSSSNSNGSASSSVDKKNHHEFSISSILSQNYDGLRTDIIRKMGYSFIAQCNDDDNTATQFIRFLEKIISRDKSTLTPKETLDTLCYYLVGAYGCLDLCSNGIFYTMVYYQKLNILVKSIEFLHKHFIKGKAKDIPSLNQYRIDLERILLRILIIGNIYRDFEKIPHDSLRYFLDNFPHKEDVNETSNYSKKKRHRDILQEYLDGNALKKYSLYGGYNLDYLGILIEFSENISSQDLATALKNNLIRNISNITNRVRRDYKNNAEIISQLIKHLDEKEKDETLNIFFECGLASRTPQPHHFYVHKEEYRYIDKTDILMILEHGIQPNYSKNLYKLAWHAAIYGLNDICDEACNKLQAQNPRYLEQWPAELDPLHVLTSDYFDMDALKCFQRLFMPENAPCIIFSTAQLLAIQNWLASTRDLGLKTAKPADKKTQNSKDTSTDRKPEFTQLYTTTESINNVFNFISNYIKAYKASKPKDIEESIESIMLKFILEFPIYVKEEFVTAFLQVILKEVIDSKTLHEEGQSFILSQTFKMLEKEKKIYEFFMSHGLIILKFLIHQGCNPGEMLSFFVETCHGFKVSPAFFKENVSFFNQDCIKKNLHPNSVYSAMITWLGFNQHADVEMIPFLGGLLETIDQKSWDSIIKIHFDRFNRILQDLERGVESKIQDEEKFLKITQYLLAHSQSTYRLEPTLETIAFINLKKQDHCKLHEAYFLQKYSYYTLMMQAKSKAIKKFRMEEIFGKDASTFSSGSRLLAQESMLDCLTILVHQYFPNCQNNKQILFNSMNKTIIVALYNNLASEARAYYIAKYSLTDSPKDNQLLIKTLQLLKFSVATKEFMTQPNRDNKIWDLQSVKVLSLLYGLNFSNDPKFVPMMQAIASIYQEVQSNPAHLKKFFENLSFASDAYYKLKVDTNNHLTSELMYNILYKLLNDVPSCNLNKISEFDLHQVISSFYHAKYWQCSEEERNKIIDSPLIQIPVFSADFIEKFKQELLKTLEEEIMWGYTDLTTIESLLAQPINLHYSETNEIIPPMDLSMGLEMEGFEDMDMNDAPPLLISYNAHISNTATAAQNNSNHSSSTLTK